MYIFNSHHHSRNLLETSASVYQPKRWFLCTMRFVCVLLFFTSFWFCTKSNHSSPSPTPFPPPREDYVNTNSSTIVIQFSFFTAIQILLLGALFILLLLKLFVHTCTSVTFVKFETNLSTMIKTLNKDQDVSLLVMSVLYATMLIEYEECWYFLLLYSNTSIFSINPFLYKIIHLRTVLFILIVLFYICPTPFPVTFCA